MLAGRPMRPPRPSAEAMAGAWDEPGQMVPQGQAPSFAALAITAALSGVVPQSPSAPQRGVCVSEVPDHAGHGRNRETLRCQKVIAPVLASCAISSTASTPSLASAASTRALPTPRLRCAGATKRWKSRSTPPQGGVDKARTAGAQGLEPNWGCPFAACVCACQGRRLSARTTLVGGGRPSALAHGRPPEGRAALSQSS